MSTLNPLLSPALCPHIPVHLDLGRQLLLHATSPTAVFSMSVSGPSPGLTITDPLVLYRALVTSKRILQDPAQLRLALHLQKLYERLRDYEPALDYKHRLEQLSKAVDKPKDALPPGAIGTRGVWSSLLAQKEKRDSLALARILTDKEAAQNVHSPKGLILHGEVGTGKSMLIDLFADCLPNRKKKRWHFNTFILEAIARLEQLSRHNATLAPGTDDGQAEHSLLWLARDLIQTSPILFLDEFQLPDRAASKIMTSVMTSFFQLGGVLIATSNRMPDELAKAAGIEFVPPPRTRKPLGSFLGLGSSPARKTRAFSGGSHGEFADFLELLKSRCDVWEMEGKQDYRRGEAESALSLRSDTLDEPKQVAESHTFDSPGIVVEGDSQERSSQALHSPAKYLVRSSQADAGAIKSFEERFLAQQHAAVSLSSSSPLEESIPWKAATLKVYGRSVAIPRQYNGITSWRFDELCGSRFGSADYITIASTFHTLVLADVPVLTTLQKNEARRLITLLDALYESRCKLLVSAEAGPDDLFFPEQRSATPASDEFGNQESDGDDAVYAETFAEAYQDTTAPFRPNISSYEGGPDYTHARLQGILSPDALEDDPPNKVKRGTLAWARGTSFLEKGNNEHFDIRQHGPDFARTKSFIGEDEKFAYKRAASRLWEMCSAKWWARNEEGWWRPVPLEVRRWERPAGSDVKLGATASPTVVSLDVGPADVPKGLEEGMGASRPVDHANDKLLYEHKANPLSTSPFRNHDEPPPKISWTHVWGTMKWGKKAGAWGQGVEGLKDRKKGVTALDSDHESNDERKS